MLEAAIVLPATIFLLLLAIQLTQLQQARIMADYAAFAAARAGIVLNGDPAKMQEAAEMAVLPSFGRADSWTALGKTLLRFRAENEIVKPFGLSQVRIAILNPVKAHFDEFGAHLNRQEIDFDDVRPGATEATLLSLQVRYLYAMRVPFANRLIQTLWMAAKTGALRGWAGWDLSSPRLFTGKGADAVSASRAAASAKTIADGTPEGVSLGALVAAGAARRYYLPVEAFYTMRMQSNPFARWAR